MLNSWPSVIWFANLIFAFSNILIIVAKLFNLKSFLNKVFRLFRGQLLSGLRFEGVQAAVGVSLWVSILSVTGSGLLGV